MTVSITEVGRKLHAVIGEGDDSLEFVIPPVNAQTGATLLATFLGILTNNFGNPDEAADDMVKLSLGRQEFKDPENPTERELESRRVADDLFERASELRTEEVYELSQVAFFWQTQGGITAARAFAEGGEFGYPKALDVLAQATGLVAISMLTSTGSSSESESGPTEPPATSTPQKSGEAFRRAPQPTSPNHP